MANLPPKTPMSKRTKKTDVATLLEQAAQAREEQEQTQEAQPQEGQEETQESPNAQPQEGQEQNLLEVMLKPLTHAVLQAANTSSERIMTVFSREVDTARQEARTQTELAQQARRELEALSKRSERERQELARLLGQEQQAKAILSSENATLKTLVRQRSVRSESYKKSAEEEKKRANEASRKSSSSRHALEVEQEKHAGTRKKLEHLRETSSEKLGAAKHEIDVAKLGKDAANQHADQLAMLAFAGGVLCLLAAFAPLGALWACVGVTIAVYIIYDNAARGKKMETKLENKESISHG